MRLRPHITPAPILLQLRLAYALHNGMATFAKAAVPEKI